MLKSLTQQQASPVYQSSTLTSNETSNRSARRQAILREKKQEMKEQKKYHKHTDNSGRFNPKKSRKVAPLNPSVPLRNAATTEKKTNTPVHQFTVTHIELESEEIETAQEVVFVQQQQQQQKQEQQEDQEQEEDLRDINKDEDLSKEEEQQEKALSVKEQETVTEYAEETVIAEEILDPVVGEKVYILPVIEENNPNVDTNGKAEHDSDTARNNNETNGIHKNLIGTIEEIKHAPEQNRTIVSVKETKTSEPSMMPNPFDKDDILSSTSNSNIKKKASLITRLFKHGNTSKKEINTTTASPSPQDEKKKKGKAWKIWKKLN